MVRVRFMIGPTVIAFIQPICIDCLDRSPPHANCSLTAIDGAARRPWALAAARAETRRIDTRRGIRRPWRAESTAARTPADTTKVRAWVGAIRPASRKSSIFLRRMIGSMFMRVNVKCAHQVRPPSACDSEAAGGRGIAVDCSNHRELIVYGGARQGRTARRLGTDGTGRCSGAVARCVIKLTS
jgi:hypothetical protein